ncbi:MAG: UDP-N-acetylmuramoyl-L-alanyl-D-glutamate--2,6-diaminopimelate ligase [Burkholderiaceae bacterium]|nr:UDP-N-acetylmuramoyl-L-alanyl-D-glutamate--2,6-diaminopimelate ligase [Burkholderiaceae bacterium]
MTPAADMIARKPGEAGRWLRARLAAGAELSADSRDIRPGDGFVAMPGERHDGRDYIGQAQVGGAAAIAYDPAGGAQPVTGVPAIAVAGLRRDAGLVAAEYYGRPSSRLRVVAITGTNGKTSCSQWIAQGWSAMGRRAGVVGTLGSAVFGDATGFQAPALTTPDAVSMQRLLAAFERAAIDVVAIEASSIGLEQHRLAGTDIEVAVYTNLTRDHLDYHGDMAAYVAAKRRLFADCEARAAVVNGNDAHGATMLEAFARPGDAIVYGEAPLAAPPGVRRLEAIRIVERGESLELAIDGDWGRFDVRLGLLGRFNATNALAVAGAWLALGLEVESVAAGLAGLVPVTGRMQMLRAADAPLAVVDYAHTPDAITHALGALRPVARARDGALVCVLGAGGDRDAGKRPLMGRAAEAGADRVVITSDNPRSESPQAIADAIRNGMAGDPWLVELDRAMAIRLAIAAAEPADVVLIAGKGHEQWQEIDGNRQPFSDAEVAAAALHERGGQP